MCEKGEPWKVVALSFWRKREHRNVVIDKQLLGKEICIKATTQNSSLSNVLG